MSTLTCENLVLISQTTLEKFKFDQNSLITLYNQRYILEDHLYKIYLWFYRVNGTFWLISNYSKVVWDINTKFSPVLVLMRFQLFAQFERFSSKNKTAMPLTILNFSRAWQEHFLSHTLQTWQVCFFWVDVQMIYVSLLDTSDCFKVEKNEKAFLSSCSELLGLVYIMSFKVIQYPWHSDPKSTVIKNF